MSKAPPLSDNMVQIRTNVFLVRTQAGFRKALKQFAEEKPREVRGYPKAYPSLVTLSYGYCGYHYVAASCMSLASIEEIIANEKVRNKKHQEKK